MEEELIHKAVIHKDAVLQLHHHVVHMEVVQQTVVVVLCQDHVLNIHHIMVKTVDHILKLQDAVHHQDVAQVEDQDVTVKMVNQLAVLK